jgi:membrane protein insertase Oxa1/YidC/SpoIIIJ
LTLIGKRLVLILDKYRGAIFLFAVIMRTCLFPINVKGGLLWFENLARADPTYILPTISVFSIIAIVYVNIFFG